MTQAAKIKLCSNDTGKIISAISEYIIGGTILTLKDFFFLFYVSSRNYFAYSYSWSAKWKGLKLSVL